MIRVSNLNVSYGTSQVLQDISFHVNQGECLVITGSSGCGKSTLARVLTGIIPNAIAARVEGTVTISGMDILHTPVADVAGQVGVADHVHLGDGVVVGAQSGVKNDIPGGQTYFGNPAGPMAEISRQLAALRRLPDMRDAVKRMERELEALRSQVADNRHTDVRPAAA